MVSPKHSFPPGEPQVYPEVERARSGCYEVRVREPQDVCRSGWRADGTVIVTFSAWILGTHEPVPRVRMGHLRGL